MIITLLFILLIVIFLCYLSIYSSINSYPKSCSKYDVQIKYVRASRLQDIQINKIGINMINLKLDRDVPCGIYALKTAYGDATLYINNTDLRSGYLNMKNMDNIINVNLFDLWYLDRIGSDDNPISKIYNLGCCSRT